MESDPACRPLPVRYGVRPAPHGDGHGSLSIPCPARVLNNTGHDQSQSKLLELRWHSEKFCGVQRESEDGIDRLRLWRLGLPG